MTKIRKINVSQVEGTDANNTDANEVRPFGETAFYLDTNGDTNKLVLMMFDGVRIHQKSKILSPGVLYGSNADSGDGAGLDTVKLIPDATIHSNGSDQYLIVDPTFPNHIHLRAGGAIDNSSAELFLGGELTHVRVSDGNDTVTISTTQTGEGNITRNWTFDNLGQITFPDSSVQTTAWKSRPVPASSIGAAGDKQGDLAFDGSYMYYCTQDFASETYSSTIVVTYSGFNPDIVKGSIPQPQAGWAFVHNGTTYTLASNAVENNPGEWNCELTTSISVTAGDTVTLGPVFSADIWKRVAWSVDTW